MIRKFVSSLALALGVAAAPAFALEYNQNVTPDIINGSGNLNGAFTTNRVDGVELGLRAKLRFNEDGQPENTFNSNGAGTYTFPAGVAPVQLNPGVGVWSFEWSINTSYDNQNPTGLNLDDLTYSLSMTSDNGAEMPTFDPINSVNPNPMVNAVQWDHAIGNNSTGNGGGSKIPNNTSNAAGYAALIGNNNVAQNSWQPQWYFFDGSNMQTFNPNAVGNYNFVLTAYDSNLDVVASTAMTVSVVPEPTSFALAGIALVGAAGYAIRRKRRSVVSAA